MNTSTASARFPRLGAFFTAEGPNPDHRPILARFRELGLVTAQLGDPFVADLVARPEQRAAFLADFAAAGVQIVGLAAYRNLIAPDPAQRLANLEHLKGALRLAPELGAFAVATETGTRNPGSDWDPSPENQGPAAWALMLDSVGELLAVAESAGSVLAIEGYVNNVVGRLDQLDTLFARFPSRHLGLMLDPYNYITRDLLPVADLICEEFLRRHADRFVLAHLKDVAPFGADGAAVMSGRTDLVGTPEFCTGVFPQQPYIRFLRDRRPDLPVIFEHLPDDHLPDAIRRFLVLAGRGPVA